MIFFKLNCKNNGNKDCGGFKKDLVLIFFFRGNYFGSIVKIMFKCMFFGLVSGQEMNVNS